MPASSDFATAVKFTKLAHKEKYGEAAELALPESPAARYLAHQTLFRKAERINGITPLDRQTSFKPDPATGSIKITDKDDQNRLTYTWRDFQYDQGKVVSWTGKSGPVQDVLWTRETSGKSRGRKAVLKSAYRSNGGNLLVVAELSSSKGTSWGDAEYTAKGGYRQTVAEQGASDLAKGEKTLAYFLVEDAKFGGTLHMPYYTASGTAEGDWQLELAIK